MLAMTSSKSINPPLFFNASSVEEEDVLGSDDLDSASPFLPLSARTIEDARFRCNAQGRTAVRREVNETLACAAREGNIVAVGGW
jgi:hypothetical protein|tara:strand:- start:599 stop:853 length:255 start_codon:yes stop_codon:yes gene_type:complete